MQDTLRNRIRNLAGNSLARNTGWMLLGQGLNLLFQVGYFTLLARLLGVKEYGIFAGAFAFVSIATPYCALGSGLLFVRYVSEDEGNFAVYWGNILLSTLLCGSALTIILYVVAPHILNPTSASLVLILACSECVFRQLVICISQVFQAYEQLQLTMAIVLLTSFLKLTAVLALAAIVHRATAMLWVDFSLIVSALAALVASLIVVARCGGPRFSLKLLWKRLSEGFGFSLAGSSQSAYNDIDKAMMSHYGMNVANGIYTMAYRIVDLATIPVNALDAAVLPRFFRQAQHRAKDVVSLSGRLAMRSAFLAIVGAVLMFITAPVIPYIVGKDFHDSVEALRWLCLLPAFRSIHQLTGCAITGLGYQRYRTTAQCFVAVFNLGLNIWLIPRYGWIGAAWASLAADGSLAAANWSVLRFLEGHLLTEESLRTSPQSL